MCDTLGKLGQGRALFAKNSDRSPNEVQILEHHPRQTHAPGQVQCTYIAIPQVEETYEVLLSRPSWMWGAEMGVNEFGLCIGNEAVFTKGAYGKTGLTGMDMVRLALERSKTAKQALELLIELLETHGQGGNCGFDHDFYYDNAFLIMDAQALFVLETAGKRWVYKAYGQATISNRLSIGADGDAYSRGEVCNFRSRFTEPVFTLFSGSASRKRQTCACLPAADTVAGCMTALRQHEKGVKNPFACGSVSSACMHYGAMVGDHTTASMVVQLEAGRTLVWATGTSTPCVSLFKPWLFGTEAVLPVVTCGDAAGEAYWRKAETFRRALLGKQLPRAFYDRRDAIQTRWLEQAEQLADADFPAFAKACLAEETAFYESWANKSLPTVRCAPGFTTRWNKKTRTLNP